MLPHGDTEQVLVNMCDAFMNKELDAEIRTFLATTKGVALQKGEADCRPLGMGCKLRVIATLYSNCLHTNKLKRKDGEPVEDSGLRQFSDFFLQHRQFGVGVKGGLEAMCHSMRLLTDLYPDRVLIKLDIRNAFNEFLREKGIEVMAREFPDTLRLIANFYAKQAPTFFTDSNMELFEILLQAGSSQGDVYGGVLFASAFSEPLTRTLREFENLLEVFSYYDDTYFLVSIEHAERVVAFFSEACAAINLELKLNKSQMWCSAGPVPAHVLPQITARDRGVDVCGTPIGTPEFVAEFLQETVDRYLQLHELTRGIPHAQAQYLLLRFCTNSNLVHWLRTVPPDVMGPFCAQFDADILGTLKELLKATPQRPGADAMSQLEIFQARQHVKQGGLGLPASEQISSPAWLGSFGLTKKLIHSIFRGSTYSPFMDGLLDSIAANPRAVGTLRHISAAWAKLRDIGDSVARQIVPVDALEQLGDKGQRKLTDTIYRANDKLLMDLARASDRPAKNVARILSCKGRDSGAWLNAIPKLPVFELQPADARIAFRLRLGMTQQCIIPGSYCVCGERPDPYGDHYLSCNRRGHLTARHDAVQSVGNQCARTTGKYSTTYGMLGILPHPQWQGPDSFALKPDQKIHEWTEDGRHCLLDYAICHPCATSYVAAASRTELATAKHVEKVKDTQYKEASESEGYAFSPVVLETYGAHGECAEAYLDRATAILNNELPEGTAHTWTSRSFRAFYSQRIAIALQRGNAKAIRLQALSDMRVDGNPDMEPPVACH
jgi:hypothetical protein